MCETITELQISAHDLRAHFVFPFLSVGLENLEMHE